MLFVRVLHWIVKDFSTEEIFLSTNKTFALLHQSSMNREQKREGCRIKPGLIRSRYVSLFLNALSVKLSLHFHLTLRSLCKIMVEMTNLNQIYWITVHCLWL